MGDSVGCGEAFSDDHLEAIDSMLKARCESDAYACGTGLTVRFLPAVSVCLPEPHSIERSSMGNGANGVRESLQSAINQPVVRLARPRRDDRNVADTVSSKAVRHRPQRLQYSRSNPICHPKQTALACSCRVRFAVIACHHR